jgi:signal peptidase II
LQFKSQLKGLGLYLLLLLVLVPFDQLTKLWVRTNFYVGESRPPTGFLRLTYLQNTGASFGIFPDGALFFTIFSTVALVVMVLMMVFVRHWFPFLDSAGGKVAMGLISAGTLGNLIDRYYLGFVVDFIDLNFWPVFNVADSAIVVGSILLALLVVINYKDLKDDDGGQV